MKLCLKYIYSWAAGLLLLLTASVQANPVTSWSQMGFTIELSSGVLNVSPVGTLSTADASWQDSSTPWSGINDSSTADGFAYASAIVGPSAATGLALNADNYFLLDAYATTEAAPGMNGLAQSAALALYNLSFSGVVGPMVTITLTPLFYANAVADAGTGLEFAYASAFLSLGDLAFYSSNAYGDGSGYAAFEPLTLVVGANDTVQLNAAVTAGVAVPETSGSIGLLALGLTCVLGLRRKIG